MADLNEELLNYELGDDDIDDELLPDADEDALLLSDEELEKDLNIQHDGKKSVGGINESKQPVTPTMNEATPAEQAPAPQPSCRQHEKSVLELSCADDALLCDADTDIPGLSELEPAAKANGVNRTATTAESTEQPIDANHVIDKPLPQQHASATTAEQINYVSKIERNNEKFYGRYAKMHNQRGHGNQRGYNSARMRFTPHPKMPPQRFLIHGSIYPAQNNVIHQQQQQTPTPQQLQHIGPPPPNLNPHLVIPTPSHARSGPPPPPYYAVPSANGFYDARNQYGNYAQNVCPDYAPMYVSNAPYVGHANPAPGPPVGPLWRTDDIGARGNNQPNQHGVPQPPPPNGSVESAGAAPVAGLSCVGKVLINPNFKGGLEAAKNKFIEETQLLPAISNEEKLKRQQEQFINENRQFLGKRRYERSPSPLSSNSGNFTNEGGATVSSSRMRSRSRSLSRSRSRSRERSYSPKRRGGGGRLDRERDRLRERDRERGRDRERDRFAPSNRDRLRERERARERKPLPMARGVTDARHRRSSTSRSRDRSGNQRVGTSLRRRHSSTPPSNAHASEQTGDEDDEIRAYRLQIEKQKEQREKFLRDKELNRLRTIEKQKQEKGSSSGGSKNQGSDKSTEQSTQAKSGTSKSGSGLRAQSPQHRQQEQSMQVPAKQEQQSSRHSKTGQLALRKGGTASESNKRAAVAKIDSESKRNIIKYVTGASSGGNGEAASWKRQSSDATRAKEQISAKKKPVNPTQRQQEQQQHVQLTSPARKKSMDDELCFGSIKDDEVELGIDECELDYEDMDLEYERKLLLSPAESCGTTGSQSSSSTPEIECTAATMSTKTTANNNKRKIVLMPRNSPSKSSSHSSLQTPQRRVLLKRSVGGGGNSHTAANNRSSHGNNKKRH